MAFSLAACGGDSTPPVGRPTAELSRGCHTAVFGDVAARAERHAVTAGPLRLLLVDADRPASAFEPSTDVKALAVLEADAEVTVVVPQPERRRVSLLYDFSSPGPRRPLRLSDGTSSVRLSACPKGIVAGTRVEGVSESQFNGGLFVRGAHCAPIDVWVGQRDEPLRRWLPFGTGARPCPPGSGQT